MFIFLNHPGICRTERPLTSCRSPWGICRGRLGERLQDDTVQKSWLKLLFLLRPCYKHPACDQHLVTPLFVCVCRNKCHWFEWNWYLSIYNPESFCKNILRHVPGLFKVMAKGLMVQLKFIKLQKYINMSVIPVYILVFKQSYLYIIKVPE